MRKDYDLNKLKIKRRGLLPDLPAQETQDLQVNVLLDKEIVTWFEHESHHYQTLINQVLRDFIAHSAK